MNRADLYDILVGNSITILAILSLILTIISLLVDNSKKIARIIFWSIIVIPIVGLFDMLVPSILMISVYFIMLNPLIIFVFILSGGTLLMYMVNYNEMSKKTLQRYTLVNYIIIMAFLLFAIELAKVSYNTWGSGTIYFGAFMIVLLFPLRFLTREMYKQPFAYGLIELLTGLTSITIIGINGFSHSEFNGESVDIIRNGLVLLSIVMIIEGVLLFYKHYKKVLTIKQIN